MGSIVFNNVSFYYENKAILDSLSEDIEDGMLYVLTGIAGSGKSTLLKLAAGLLSASKGSIVVNNNAVENFDKREMLEYHENSGFVFQNAALISNMTVYENLALYYYYHTSLHDKVIWKQIESHIQDIDLMHKMVNRPGELSTGEKMLINIIRAISHDPEYIFWDEPTENLDQISAKNVKDKITSLKQKGKTMIMTTHDIELAFAVADKIGVLHNGSIIESNVVSEIQKSHKSIVQQLLKL